MRDGNCVIQNFDWPNDRRDSAPFFRAIDAIARDFGPAQTIVVGLGPGSYAGARIAISVAVGLQVAWDATLLGYPSLCAFDVDAREYWAVGDARRESYFVARIKDGESMEGPFLCTRNELETRLTNMVTAAPVYSSEHLTLPHAITVAFPTASRLAAIAACNKAGAISPPLEPIYLREPYITQPRSGVR